MTPRSSPVRPRRRQPLSRRRPVRRLAAVVPLPSPSPHPSPRPQGGSPSKVGRYRSGVYFPASSWPRELNTLPHLRSRRPVEVAPAWRATSAMSAQRSRTSCTCGGQAPRRFAGDRRVGNPHRDLDRGVQVIGLDHVVPTEHLLGVGERPVVTSASPSLTRTVDAVCAGASCAPPTTCGSAVIAKYSAWRCGVGSPRRVRRQAQQVSTWMGVCRMPGQALSTRATRSSSRRRRRCRRSFNPGSRGAGWVDQFDA
jgi:hypothetical protein